MIPVERYGFTPNGKPMEWYGPNSAVRPPLERTNEMEQTTDEFLGRTIGIKNDDGKMPMHLIPPEAVFSIAEVLRIGAIKYGERNYEKGLLYSRVYSAALRHLLTWWGGENNDPETGFSHINHALCCLVMLSTYEARRMNDFDDRPFK